VKTYVLVHAEVGRAAEVARAIARDPCVLSVDTVAGAYDVIAQIEVEGSCDVADLAARLRIQPGVTRLVTCSIAGHQPLWDESLAPALVGA
jgi:hypothetical protein